MRRGPGAGGGEGEARSRREGAPPAPDGHVSTPADEAVEEEASRREARRGWLVLVLALLLACAFFALAIWRVVWPALRAVWERVSGA